MARLKGLGHIFKRGKTFYLQFEVNGKRKTISLKTTLRREAESKAKEYLEPALQSKSKEEVIFHAAKAKKIITAGSIKLENVWKEYLKSPSRPDSSKGTLGNHERHWNNFVTWLEDSYPRKVRLSEINDTIAKEYAHYLWSGQKKKISAGTFNYHIKSLTLITRILMSKGGLDTNPWQDITRKTEIKQHRKEFTNDQIQQIFDSFSDPKLKINHKQEYEVLFHIAAFTGLRLIDAVNLKWDSINFNRNIISLIPVKTQKVQRSVNIPIHPVLKEKFEQASEWKNENDFVLPKLTSRYETNSHGIKKDCIKILEFCGFKERGEGRGINRRLYGFHSFRHFFASTCADAGVPVATLAEILGDNISTLNKYYIHAQEASRQKMVNALGNTTQTKVLVRQEQEKLELDIEPERKQLIELAKELPLDSVRLILEQLKTK